MPMLVDEQELFRFPNDRNAPSLEWSLLVLSGLGTDAEIRAYQATIDALFCAFAGKHPTVNTAARSRPPAYLHREIAHRLFEYLWTSKPKRFGDAFLLTDVVDAQVDPDVNRTVGTCVGLTSLYSVLGVRAGLSLSLLVSSDHLLNRLTACGKAIDIDHTDPQGFDCRKTEGFREFPLRMLAANVLNSRGLNRERSGDYPAARSDYEKALRLNRDYANAWNNRGNMRFSEGDLEGAVADYTEAIRLQPQFVEAYCNRGMARQRLGCHEAARRDYRRAESLNPEYRDACKCLQILEDLRSGR